MNLPTKEELTERRLQREARTELLHVTVIGKGDTNHARVEVTYQHPGDIERSGYLRVHMPADVDPWITASEAATAWLESLGELEYSSVDDIYAE